MEAKKPKIIVIVGPTSIGKTSLSIEVAKSFDGEVISADSRQVYADLDIGTGKVTLEEMGQVPHHMLSIADPKTVFTASDFVIQAKKVLQKVLEKKKLPVIAGGTGFYIDALVGRVTLAETPPNKALRQKLEKMTLEQLQSILKKTDPRRYKTIDTKNPRRLIRSIEIADALGQNPIPKRSLCHYDILWIGLYQDQDILHTSIHTRLLDRLKDGMLEESKKLHKNGLSYERMEELGLEYRYISYYLQNKLTYEEMVSQLEKEICHYAKRQMTWFKKNKEIKWFKPNEKKEILNLVNNFLK